MMNFIKSHTGSFVVVSNNQSYTFDQDHPNYNGLVESVKCGDAEEFHNLINTGVMIEDWAEGNFKFTNGVLFFGDEEVHRTITVRIVDMIKDGFDYQPMLRFLERLYNNPSFRAINELYTFLEHKFLPITPEGYFLAYKVVRPDFKDKYSGTIDNSVGQTPTMPRFKVDDNCDVGCSQGLHIGAIDYVRSYGSAGDKVVICKVDPADVVSVPLDSSHQKVRTCKYEVVGEYEEDLLPAVVDDYDDEYDDEDWDEDDDNYTYSEMEQDYEDSWYDE